MKVLLHYSPGPEWQRRLAALAGQGIDVQYCSEDDDARFYSLLPETEVIWHILRRISASDIAQAAKLRLIHKIGVGVNTIDLAAAKERGVAVCNIPGTNSRSVAEMALLLILACLRRLPLLDRATREGHGWKLDNALQDSFGEIGGRTIGLIGYGAIPSILTPALQALGATVLYTSKSHKPSASATFRSLQNLLEEADIVSLHLPLTPETEHLIGDDEFKRMRPGAILINTARGGLVHEPALVRALESGRLAAAGLDVFENEPIAPDNPLLKFSNVVLTPHLAWLTRENLERSMAVAVENCRRLVEGQPLLHRVV